MKPHSRLLLVEMVLPGGNDPHLGKMLDIVLLAVPGGRDRTEPKYRTLLTQGGLHLSRVIPTDSAVSVIEAVLP